MSEPSVDEIEKVVGRLLMAMGAYLPQAPRSWCQTEDLAALIADWRKRGEALKPFAVMADQVDEWQRGTGQFANSFDANDLRRARAALKQS